MAYTVPRFDPHIHLVGKEKNNEEGEIDVISWRKNASFMFKCGGEKKRTMIMRRFFLEGDEKKEKQGWEVLKLSLLRAG